MMHLWIVDDEPRLAQGLRTAFEAEGYEVRLFARLGPSDRPWSRTPRTWCCWTSDSPTVWGWRSFPACCEPPRRPGWSS